MSPPEDTPGGTLDDKKTDDSHNNSNPNKNRDGKKRGMKPRAQRNRKRPRSEQHSNSDIVVQSRVVPLQLDGQNKAPSAPDWIRIVEPYPYTFASYAKARWLGRSVLDIYTTEFGSYPQQYYETAIAQGRILVSDRKVAPSYLIKGNDVLTHTVHRHEPGVAVSTRESPHVKIQQETETLLAVDKPGTLPVHPCGGYHQNSLMNLLEPVYGKLFTIHRLDRLTSGLLVLAKTSEVAKEWGKAIQERDACEKLYLARVRGRFPRNCPDALPNLSKDANSKLPVYGEWLHEAKAVKGKEDEATARRRNAYGVWITDVSGNTVVDTDDQEVSLNRFSESEHTVDAWLQALKGQNEQAVDMSLQWLHLACPVRVEKPKNGVCVSGTFDDLESALYLKTVKPAQTSFAVVRYDQASDSTVVLCRPGTGRTHQIRLALQHLGHPIANDPNYGGSIWFGSPQGEEICKKAQARLDVMDEANKEETPPVNGGGITEEVESETLVTTDVPATAGEVKRMADVDRQEEEPLEDFVRRTCVWCARSRGQDRAQLELLVRSTGIWLHALQYTIRVGDAAPTSFRTDLPTWSLATSS